MAMSRNADPLPDEFALIAEIFAPLASGDLNSFGLTDDAAIIAPTAGKDLVVTADMMVAGVHFFADDAPELIARKLMRVNLSDLAAKCATPHGYILTVALPRGVSMAWLRGFASGLARDQAEFGINLLGGDTTATGGPLTLSVTAMGWVKRGQMVRRSGARAGDDVYVTGTIGDAWLGLKVRRQGAIEGLTPLQQDYLLQHYLLPVPRNLLSQHLMGRIHASIDISDGLAADLGHVTRASSVGAIIQSSAIPLSDAARTMLAMQHAMLEDLISGGDDYELLFTAAVKQRRAIAAIAAKTGIAISRIGQVTAERDLVFVNAEGGVLTVDRPGYRHF